MIMFSLYGMPVSGSLEFPATWTIKSGPAHVVWHAVGLAGIPPERSAQIFGKAHFGDASRKSKKTPCAKSGISWNITPQVVHHNVSRTLHQFTMLNDFPLLIVSLHLGNHLDPVKGGCKIPQTSMFFCFK